MPEHDGSSGAMIAYERWPLFRRLTHAFASGSVRVLCFGMGLDPLWLGTDLLATAVIESDVFDEVFGDVVPVNAEGHAVTGQRKLAVEGEYRSLSIMSNDSSHRSRWVLVARPV